jgi:hypothetical protein
MVGSKSVSIRLPPRVNITYKTVLAPRSTYMQFNIHICMATARYFYDLKTYSAILLQKRNLISVSLYQVAIFSWLYAIYPNITVKCCSITNLWHKHFPFCRRIALMWTVVAVCIVHCTRHHCTNIATENANISVGN